MSPAGRVDTLPGDRNAPVSGGLRLFLKRVPCLAKTPVFWELDCRDTLGEALKGKVGMRTLLLLFMHPKIASHLCSPNQKSYTGSLVQSKAEISRALNTPFRCCLRCTPCLQTVIEFPTIYVALAGLGSIAFRTLVSEALPMESGGGALVDKVEKTPESFYNEESASEASANGGGDESLEVMQPFVDLKWGKQLLDDNKNRIHKPIIAS